jgi:hypothetical protein
MTPALLALAVLVAAPGVKSKTAPEPTLVGAWAPESVTVGVQPSTPGADRWAFRPDGTWAISTGGKEGVGGHYTRNPEGSPGTMDLMYETGRTPDLCRYRVDGDTLTLSVGHCRAGRPAGLEPAPRATVRVFKRVQDK